MGNKLIMIGLFLLFICLSVNYGQKKEEIQNRINSVIKDKEKDCEIKADVIIPADDKIFEELNCGGQSFSIIVNIYSSADEATKSFNSIKVQTFSVLGNIPYKISEQEIADLPKESIIQVATDTQTINYLYLTFKFDKQVVVVRTLDKKTARRFSRYIFTAIKN